MWNTNAQAAIDRCKELGAEDSQITLDIVICSSPEALSPITKTSKNAYRNFMRSGAIGKSVIGADSIAAVKRAHPDINFRHLIMETEEAERPEKHDERLGSLRSLRS